MIQTFEWKDARRSCRIFSSSLLLSIRLARNRSQPPARLSLLRFGRLGTLAAVPVERPRQAFFKSHLRLVAQEFLGLRDVRFGVADVSLSRRLVFGCERLSRNSLQFFEDFIEGNASPTANVENFAGHVRC